MEQISYKKYLASAFIAFLVVSMVSYLLPHVLTATGSFSFEIQVWRIILSCIIEIALASFIAFYPKCKASFISKAGCCLYVVFKLVCIVNQCSYHFSGENLLPNTGILAYLYSFVLYASGLLLLIWGCKLWLPCKIVFSISVLLNVICDMIWTKLIPMFQNYSDYPYEEIEALQTTVDTVALVSFIVIVVTLILTIIWTYKKTKLPMYENQNLNII